MEKLFATPGLAEYLQVPVTTIYAWRHRGYGPPAIRLGRSLRYRASDVDRWLANMVATGEPGSPNAA